MNPPCKKCEDRHNGCHASCERYKEFRAFCDEQGARRRDKAIVDRYGHDRVTKAIKIRNWQNQ